MDLELKFLLDICVSVLGNDPGITHNTSPRELVDHVATAPHLLPIGIVQVSRVEICLYGRLRSTENEPRDLLGDGLGLHSTLPKYDSVRASEPEVVYPNHTSIEGSGRVDDVKPLVEDARVGGLVEVEIGGNGLLGGHKKSLYESRDS